LITHWSPSRRAVVLSERGSQPLLPLLLGSVLEQDLLISGVGRHHAEERRRAQAVGQHLVHVGVLEEAQAAAAVLLREMRRPQARLLHLGPDVRAQLARRLAITVADAFATPGPEPVLVRQDLAVHDLRGEVPNLVDPVRESGDGLDVHGHGDGLAQVTERIRRPPHRKLDG
jgi:hypothetical protein